MAADDRLPARGARTGGLLTALAALVAVVVLAASGAFDSPGATSSARTAEASPWTEPQRLGSCAAAGAPLAAFPRDSPYHATGHGAVVWSAAGSCAGGGTGTLVATIGAGDVVGAPAYARTAGGGRLALRAPLALAPAPHGQLMLAGSASSPARADGALVQASAGGPFAPLGAIAGTAGPRMLATGYLGDVAAVWPTGGGGPRGGARFDVERYFAHALSPPRTVPASAGAAEAPTVALDYRTDAIVAWSQGGSLLAAELPGRGGVRPTGRLAGVGRSVRVADLISDDGRAMVVWADERAGTTSVYLDYSAPHVRFGRPQLLERFTNPGGLADPIGSPQLIRLSTESVMLAWSGAQDGHWVVRTAAIDYNGIGRFNTVSDPHGEALLSDLQPGPHGEAIALWTEPQPQDDGRLSTAREAVAAARGGDGHPDATYFGAPEQIAPAGANADATLAIDPDSDRALALWRGAGGIVEYAVRSDRR